jgi:hypothetical protein
MGSQTWQRMQTKSITYTREEVKMLKSKLIITSSSLSGQLEGQWLRSHLKVVQMHTLVETSMPRKVNSMETRTRWKDSSTEVDRESEAAPVAS